MSEPFIGEIQLFAFDYPPKGWAFCAGQTLAINANQALFSLLGTTYGGNGTTNFMLPDLRGRVAIGFNGSFPLGARAGEISHTLLGGELPPHNHLVNVDAATPPSGVAVAPTTTSVLGQTSGGGQSVFPFAMLNSGTPGGASLDSRTIGVSGGQPHQNLMPFLGMNFCIALVGIFPSRN